MVGAVMSSEVAGTCLATSSSNTPNSVTSPHGDTAELAFSFSIIPAGLAGSHLVISYSIEITGWNTTLSPLDKSRC